jgi:PAS domain S-box-containing protein
VLILNSYHQGEAWTDNEIIGIFSEFGKHHPNLIPLVESLDTKRFPAPEHLLFLKEYLLYKYRDKKIDMIIALDNPALDLLVKNSADLFPEVPVVFAGINGYRPEMLEGRKNITGVMERQDVVGTLKMALKLHPPITRVLAIHDYTASGIAVRRETEEALAEFAAAGLDIRYSANVPFDQLSHELQAMPAGGLVLILTYVTDQAGRTFTREESTRLISAHSSAPVYAMHETRLGFGIVGGLLLEGVEHGRQAAHMADRILLGEDPSQIPVEESRSRCILDYQVLNRWQIPEQLLPAGATVINRPESLWDRHRMILIPALAIMTILLLSAATMLVFLLRMRRAEAKIRKSEERFRTSFDADSIGRTLTSADGILLRVNPRLCEMLGYRAEEISTMPFSAITHPDDLAASREAVRCLLAGEQNVYRLEKRYLHKDGSPLWTEMTTTLLRDEQGKPLHFITGILDISERKTAEDALQESEANYRFVLGLMQESLSVIDTDGNFLMANNTAAKNLTGGRPEDLNGKNIQQLLPEEQGRKLLTTYRRTVDSGTPLVQEVLVTLPQGNRWFHNTLQPLEYGRERIKAVLSISLDITEQKQAEVDRNKLQAQLHQAQKMEAIGTLAGGIAHDFNNILGAILGYAELVRDDCSQNSETVRDLDQIILAGNRAKDLVRQILAFSRQAEAEKIPLQPAFIVKEALKLLRASLPTTIAIIQDIDAETAPILADPTQIHQLTVNLCTNAFHAMEEQGGTLTVSLSSVHLPHREQGENDGMATETFVRLSISDTGTGIAPEIRENIFDPYFTTKVAGKGTGIGLSIVHGIVTSYGGTITCESQPGQGTTFHITLPALTELAPMIEDLDKEAAIPAGNERILLIDDEEILIEITQTMLQRLGYHVTVRRSSLEALSSFQNQPEAYDLVITDQTMPGMTGMDLARCMLQIRPNLPIILCTGYSSLISEDKAMAMGIKGFALKPLAKKDIAALIRKVLNGKSVQA